MSDTVYEIGLLYIRELRAAMRERGIVINALLVPLLLYPVLMWAIFSGMSFVSGYEQQRTSRLMLEGLPAAHESLATRLSEDDRFELVPLPESRGATDLEDESLQTEAALRTDSLDLWVVFLPPAAGGSASLEHNFRVELSWNSAVDRSSTAEQRFSAVLEDYRREWIRNQGRELGIDDAEWLLFETEEHNIASSEDVGAFILGLVVPILMILMIAIGCFYPAIDTTAGERERSTWETLMASGARRGSIFIAKYLYVATLGALAGMLNLFALTLSMRAVLAPLTRGAEEAIYFALPWSGLPVMVVAAFLLGLFVAAVMMLFAVFARSFKEGQAMIGPAYLATMLPPLLVMSPDLVLTYRWALVPVANVTLLFRQAMTGTAEWPLVLLVFFAQGVAICLLLAVARWVLSVEGVLLGSYEGSFGRLIGQKLRSLMGKES